LLLVISSVTLDTDIGDVVAFKWFSVGAFWLFNFPALKICSVLMSSVNLATFLRLFMV
jgi:hypothetical protein